MTVLQFRRTQQPEVQAAAPATRLARVAGWLRTHRTSLCVLVPLLIVVGLVEGIGFDHFPYRHSDDPGTYASQAYAVLNMGELAPTTYWYDHPWFGWIVMAAYAFITGGFDRPATAVTSVNELMLITHIVSSALLYLFARRIQFSRIAASVAVLLFTVSPLALYYHRTGFLDNLEIAWVLAAMVFAVSPRRSLLSAFGSAVCFAAATLTKETAAIMLPVAIWLLVRNHAKRTRGWVFGVFFSTYVGLVAIYPLSAILKGELFPGKGHVSLIGAIQWQLSGRESTGSVLDLDSVSNGVFRSWLDIDPWLLLIGAAMILPALLMRRLWPVVLGLAIQLAMMLRDGYLPLPYLIALLPFAALLIAGVGDGLWKSRLIKSLRSRSVGVRVALTPIARFGTIVVLSAAVTFGVMVGPSWANKTHEAMTANPSASSQQATKWVEANLPHDAVIVTDDIIWTDLKMAGFKAPIWMFKVDLDPAINAQYLPDGWRNIQYVVSRQVYGRMYSQMPTLVEAMNNSDVIMTFGEGDPQMKVWKVRTG